MIEKELENKVEIYLKEKGINFYSESINYKGQRKTKMENGSFRNLYVVSYMVSVSDQPYDGDAFFYVSFDEKKNMVFIIGPQSFEKFE